MKNNEQGRTIQNYIKKNRVRVLISACLIAGVFVLPLLSEAKYKAFLNGFVAVIAKEYYFSSNYLKEGGASYVVNGWDGKDLGLDQIDIRNYENTLLANQTGQDLEYELTWKVDTYKNGVKVTTPENMYTLEVTENVKAENSVDITVTYGEGTVTIDGKTSSVEGEISHKIAGNGESKHDAFRMTLKKPSSVEPANKDYAVITFYATNTGNKRNQYHREIEATLRYNVTLLKDFVESFNFTQESSTVGSTVTLDMTTGIIPGTDTSQLVWVWWDATMLSPNMFNYHFNQLRINGNYTAAKEYNGRTFSLLKIAATSLSARMFEFELLKAHSFTSETGETGVLLGGNYNEASPTDYIGYYVEQKVQTETEGGGN